MKSRITLLPLTIYTNEWMVIPPMFCAAMPVGAVTKQCSPFRRIFPIIYRRKNDFPLPAFPDTKTL